MPPSATRPSVIARNLAVVFMLGCGSSAGQTAGPPDAGPAPVTPASGGTSAVAASTGGAPGSGGTTSPPPVAGNRGTGGSVSVMDAGSGTTGTGTVATDSAAPGTGSGPPTDARSSVDAGAGAVGGASGGGPSAPTSYSCTLMIGILATQEWYTAGFETMVDDSKWELLFVHSGFIELWADPQDPVWSTATMSPCAQNATKPDRVIFVALNFDFNTLAQWLPPVTAAVKNLQAKYPSAKRIELTTFIRAPGDNPCSQAPAKRSTITPAQDQAMAMVAAANPGLVVVSPKFEAKSCNEFSSNPPHPTPAGATAWAKMMADAYR